MDPMRVDTWGPFVGDATYRLEMWDAGSRADGRCRVAYRLTCDDVTLFEGDDYSPSPLHAIDSDASVGGLLCFLTLGEHDTDSEYFDGYSEEQLRWRDESPDREYLAMIGLDLEEGEV